MAERQQLQAGIVQSEQAKTLQREMEDRRKDQRERAKTAGDQLLDLLTIWEKADEAEKRELMAMMNQRPGNGRALPAGGDR